MPASGTSHKTLNIAEIYLLARHAGLPANKAIIAAAVGMAESSGRTWVTSANPDGGTNVGVWQLDTRGVGSGYTVAQLQDPATNAAAMAKGSDKGQNWGPWQTYANGAYKKFLAQAIAADKAAGFGQGSTITGNPVTAVQGVVGNLLELPKQVLDFLRALEGPVHAIMWLFDPSNWARILAGVFGFFLLIGGLVALGMSA